MVTTDASGTTLVMRTIACRWCGKYQFTLEITADTFGRFKCRYRDCHRDQDFSVRR